MIPTKTIVPQRPPQLLRRPRLVDQLHDQVDLALTLVTASAGYGKTTLLVDFAHDAPFPVCWYALDALDRDLFTFVGYVVATIKRQFPAFGAQTQRVLASLSESSSRAIRTMVGAIVQDMLDHVPEFFALILDDFHAVEDVPEVNDFLRVLLTYRPENCHVIIASRVDPGKLPLLELAARSRAADIGSMHLAFTADEVQALLARAHNLHLSREQAEELVAESEGWITGILLSTQAAWRGIRDNMARARMGEGPIYAYLAEQVFAEQPPALRDFALASSTLQEMNETLCREALGLGDVADFLREIERRSVFVASLVDKETGTWYRYHHLFRDFLQTRLQTEDPARFCRLHGRAADWFEAHEQWEIAVAHRLSAGDHRATARTMNAALSPTFYANKMETLIGWYKALPEAVCVEFPNLFLFASRAMSMLGQMDEALALANRAEVAFESRGNVERALWSRLQRATIALFRGRYTDVQALAQSVLDAGEINKYHTQVAEAHRLAGVACLNLGQPIEAVGHLRASLRLYREIKMPWETAITYLNLSYGLIRVGQVEEGWDCQDQTVELLQRFGPSSELALILNNIACERYFLVGEYDVALKYLSEALTTAKNAGDSRVEAGALLSSADLYRDLGAGQEAALLYDRAREIANQLDSADLIAYSLAGSAWAKLSCGDAAGGIDFASQACEESEGNIYQLGLSCLAFGAAHLAAGDLPQALAEVKRGRDALEQTGARRDLVRAYMLLARAHQARGDVEGALATLKQAFVMGMETRSIHYLVVEGQWLFELWKRLLEENPSDRRPADIIARIRALPDVARRVVGETAVMPPPAPALRLFGFGPGRAEKDGQPLPISAWRSALARYLIFYLLFHAPQSREQITGVFWPDVTGAKAKAYFHNLKYQAGFALGRQPITFEDGLYRLDLEPGCWCDVVAFESLLDGFDERLERLEKAVELYQGDFLQGYEGAWCVPIRERLRGRQIDALTELGERCLDQGRLDQAFARLSQAMGMDNTHEPAIRALMRLYVRDGRASSALNVYRRLEQRLARSDDSPTPETTALWREILDF